MFDLENLRKNTRESKQINKMEGETNENKNIVKYNIIIIIIIIIIFYFKHILFI